MDSKHIFLFGIKPQIDKSHNSLKRLRKIETHVRGFEPMKAKLTGSQVRRRRPLGYTCLDSFYILKV